MPWMVYARHCIRTQRSGAPHPNISRRRRNPIHSYVVSPRSDLRTMWNCPLSVRIQELPHEDWNSAISYRWHYGDRNWNHYRPQSCRNEIYNPANMKASNKGVQGTLHKVSGPLTPDVGIIR